MDLTVGPLGRGTIKMPLGLVKRLAVNTRSSLYGNVRLVPNLCDML